MAKTRTTTSVVQVSTPEAPGFSIWRWSNVNAVWIEVKDQSGGGFVTVDPNGVTPPLHGIKFKRFMKVPSVPPEAMQGGKATPDDCGYCVYEFRGGAWDPTQHHCTNDCECLDEPPDNDDSFAEPGTPNPWQMLFCES